MSTNERPGVYTSYEVTASLYGGRKGTAVGLAAAAETGEAGKAVELGAYSQALEAFGSGNLVKLAEILFLNGAPKIYAVKVEENDYATAFAALMEKGDIKFMVCDQRKIGVHDIMKNAIEGGDERGKYRIGVVESEQEKASELLLDCECINSERMMLVSHYERNGVPGSVAAAVCGVAASEDDPALPLNGAEIKGLGDIGANFSDSDVSLLISGGITPIETIAGSKTIIRGVSTKTTTGGAEDLTWREINTVMILDEVIPTIRDSLRAKFSRAKNTAQTRGAIRTQVLVALEDYLNREIIDSYGEINVAQSTDDPTVCLVNFAFTVAHGLNKIVLRAHITV